MTTANQIKKLITFIALMTDEIKEVANKLTSHTHPLPNWVKEHLVHK